MYQTIINNNIDKNELVIFKDIKDNIKDYQILKENYKKDKDYVFILDFYYLINLYNVENQEN